MRLDKFLKISLIFKTRNQAENLIEQNKILVNDKIAKPSTNIKIGDKITINYPLKKVIYEVLNIEEKNVSKEKAKSLYKVIFEEQSEI